jgi:hypothetical protein
MRTESFKNFIARLFEVIAVILLLLLLSGYQSRSETSDSLILVIPASPDPNSQPQALFSHSLDKLDDSNDSNTCYYWRAGDRGVTIIKALLQ